MAGMTHLAMEEAGAVGVSPPSPNDVALSFTRMLSGYSVEVTSRDRRSMDAAGDELTAGTEVFIAALPGDSVEQLVAAADRLKRAGLVPVPHVVARNIENLAAADTLLGQLSDAGVDRVLTLGGDRDQPAGALTDSLQLIQSGLLQKHGLGRIFIGCYPEGHPKITTAQLDAARQVKLKMAAQAGMDVTLISQFCFEAAPIVDFARRLQAEGVSAPFRVGVAGPADRGLLIKYAMICGVGASMRFLKNRPELAKGVLAGETPEGLLKDLARAKAAEPALALDGVHFFTFGSLVKSAHWANAMLAAPNRTQAS